MNLNDRVANLGRYVEHELTPRQVNIAHSSQTPVVITILEHAIRRGDEENAIMAISAMLNSGKQSLCWNVLSQIAVADVGFANLPLVADVLAYTCYGAVRQQCPPTMPLQLAVALCHTDKDASIRHLATRCAFNPKVNQYIKYLDGKTSEQLEEITRNDNNLTLQMQAGWTLFKTDLNKWLEVQTRMKDDDACFISRQAFIYAQEIGVMVNSMRMVWQAHDCTMPVLDIAEVKDAPPTEIIKGLPSHAFDASGALGGHAFVAWAKTYEPFQEEISKHPIAEEDYLALVQDLHTWTEGTYTVGAYFSPWTYDNVTENRKVHAERHGLTLEDFDALVAIYEEGIPDVNKQRLFFASMGGSDGDDSGSDPVH